MIPRFRAWDKKQKRFLDPDSDNPTDCFEIYLDGSFLGMASEDQHWEGDSRYVLMQSTGLHDCKGVEVFEGDVVADDSGTGYIRWSDSLAQWTITLISTKARADVSTWHIMNAPEMEVIGNRYESPELLEGREDES